MMMIMMMIVVMISVDNRMMKGTQARSIRHRGVMMAAKYDIADQQVK